MKTQPTVFRPLNGEMLFTPPHTYAVTVIERKRRRRRVVVIGERDVAFATGKKPTRA